MSSNATEINNYGWRCSILLASVVRMWNLEGKLEMINLGYVARCELAKDCMKALVGSHSKVFDHYVVPQRWTVKLDQTTAGVEKGHFARTVVEIDLTKPLVSLIIIQDRIQHIEFEELHTIYFECGEVGRRSNDCTKKALVQPEELAQHNSTQA
nr:uncharacterized protein LOC109183330 [Ipomoea batatas]